jgi:hypothetical protein
MLKIPPDASISSHHPSLLNLSVLIRLPLEAVVKFADLMLFSSHRKRIGAFL